MGNDNKVFEWYSRMLTHTVFEIEHGRIRFFAMAKLHFVILAAITAIASYSLAEDNYLIFSLPFILSIFGALHTQKWRGQVDSSFFWENHWEKELAVLEGTPKFRETVGLENQEVNFFAGQDFSKDQSKSKEMYEDLIQSLSHLYLLLMTASEVLVILFFYT